ncbi:MAG TPA: HD domain-containing phosphohydrolase [Gallionella sp.]|nr:HD domain-containing phosphohydrolase [Gallionella sp.]
MTTDKTKLRILNLEDQPTDAELIEDELLAGGLIFDFMRVAHAHEYYQALAFFGPHVILCDYTLPDFNGLKAVQYATKNYPEIPVIMVTGTLSDVEAIELLRVGAKDYILKDSLKRLPSAVRRVLAEKAAIQAREAAEHSLRESREKLLRSLEVMAKGMAELIELREPYAVGHQRRVADLSAAIAREMGMAEEEIHGVYLAAIIHDFGKSRIPVAILAKPGPLDAAEYQLIREHSSMGYDILRRVEFPWPIAEIVYQHHEREDGSGYPKGLKAPEILPGAKILAVADVVESMASHRPYRPGPGIDAALAEIERGRGVQYNAKVVDACLKLFRKRGYKFQ